MLEAFRSIFLPSGDYLTGKIDYLRNEFSFANSIIETFEEFLKLMNGTSEPPVVNINLPQNDSKFGFYYGDQTITIDFSWYAPFKPKIDFILSGLLVAGFLFRQYHNLPNTISGNVSPLVHSVSSSVKRS